MNFAVLHNPKTKTTDYFVESKQSEHNLYIENFENTKKLCFQKSDKFEIKDLVLDPSNEISTKKEDHIAWVETIKTEISNKHLSKCIAAQKQVIDIDSSKLNLQQIFENLIQQFSETFVYLFYIEQTVWLGASPEIIGILKETKFSTISLAGTQTNSEFTTKEKQEQVIVNEYMHDLLTANATRLESQPTQVLKFGEIQHLINEYEMEVNLDFDFESFIHKIHPSPALAGFPKQKSIDFILQNEPIDRAFYCGLVSMINTVSERYSFATIRCAQLTQNQIIFYAGGGITSDSDAESEWEETMSKINVLKCILS